MDGSILSEQAARLFRDKNFAYFATLMGDGGPQITPVWIDIDDNGLILVNTAIGRVKERNLSRDPRVAVSVADRTNPYEMVTVRGKVVEKTRAGADEHINKMAKKYLGLEKYPLKRPGEERILLKIRAEKIFHQKPE